MAKYLRYLSVWPEPEVQAVLNEHTVHLDWMYEWYALPHPSNGVSKVNVHFTGQRDGPAPQEVLGIAEAHQYFDAVEYAALAPADQQRYYLDRLHDALLRCARTFGWEEGPLSEARERMLQDGLRLEFFWKKPVSSPDRRHRAQGFIHAGPRTSIWLVFFDRQGIEQSRTLLSVTSTGSMDPGYFFGEVAWLDPQTVRVTQDNARDFWICGLDGTATFHFPRAEKGDPHGVFELGRMYFEGRVVLEDRERGLELIRRAAESGQKHALSFLKRLALETKEPPQVYDAGPDPK